MTPVLLEFLCRHRCHTLARNWWCGDAHHDDLWNGVLPQHSQSGSAILEDAQSTMPGPLATWRVSSGFQEVPQSTCAPWSISSIFKGPVRSPQDVACRSHDQFDNIHFLPKVPPSELRAWTTKNHLAVITFSDASTTPSKKDVTGFSNVSLESCPSITSSSLPQTYYNNTSSKNLPSVLTGEGWVLKLLGWTPRDG